MFDCAYVLAKCVHIGLFCRVDAVHLPKFSMIQQQKEVVNHMVVISNSNAATDVASEMGRDFKMDWADTSTRDVLLRWG
jgi:hypothetical protein